MTGRTNIGGVEIDVRADGTLLIADLKRAEDQARRFADRASGAARKVKTDGFDPLGRAVSDVKGQLIALASVGALVGLTTQAIKAGDAFSGMRSRLSLVVSEGENLLQVEESLAQLALRNRADLNATVSLYTRLRTARKDLDDATTTQILDAWSKTLVISGANATEAASATLQFAQAMGSGKLQGAELTAVLENNSRASSLIAEKMGVPIGALKKLGEEGKLTTEVLIDVFTGAGALDGEFNKMAMTVGQAGTNFDTAFTRVIGLLDQSSGATAALAGWINSLANSLIDFGVSLSGPTAEAEAYIKKIAGAQNQIVDDGEKLEGLYNDLAAAIAAGGEAAGDAARLEIAAITQRMKANKELIALYSQMAEAKLQAAEGELIVRKGDMNRPLYSDRGADGRGGLDDLLTAVPLDDSGATIGKAFGTFPAQQIGKEAAINARFGTRDQRLQSAMAQIYKTDPAELTAAQRALLEFNLKTAELEAKAKAARLEFQALNKAVADGEKYVPAGGAGGGARAASGEKGDKEKTTKLRQYTVALEEYHKTIAEIQASEENGTAKSRAAVQALLDYANATGDVAGAQAQLLSLNEILSGGDWGILSGELAKIKAELEATVEKVPTISDFFDDLPKLEPELPDKPELRREGIDDFADDLKDATKRALYDAMATGDYGDLFENIIGDAAADGLSRAVDSFVDLLFQLPWGDILGSVGKGDWGGAIASIFGGSKAGGGDMMAGRAYRVGELGPEMFVPSTNGYLVPNRVGASVGGSPTGGGSTVNVGGAQIVINGNADGVTVKQLEAALEAHRRALPAAIDSRVANRMSKGAFG